MNLLGCVSSFGAIVKLENTPFSSICKIAAGFVRFDGLNVL